MTKLCIKCQEKSTYIRELHLRGKAFHKKHSNRMTRIIFNYWKPILKSKFVGKITRDDNNKIYNVAHGLLK